MADYLVETRLSIARLILSEMQRFSKPTQPIKNASHQPRQRVAKHEKTHSVRRIMARRMKRAESRYIAQRKNRTRNVTCPVCGSPLRGKQGCCIYCGTVIDSPAPGTNDALRPMVPIDRLLFLHLDVESGKICYIESDGEHNLFGEVNLKEEKIA